jgi:hypothetical protein
MKRTALLAAAIATGCVSSPPPPPPVYAYGDVIVYWDFSRNTLVAPFSVPYDTNLAPGGGSGACSDSGVEYVSVTDLAGNLIDPYTPTISCVYQGVQGATFLTFPEGSYTFVVHGYRTVNAVPVEVHRGQGTVIVYANQANPVTVTAAGIQRDLDVFLYEGVNPLTCFAGDTLGYTLVDGIATTIDQVSGLTCGDLVAFRVANATGVDLDNLDIRVQVSNGGSVVLDSCASQPFDHFGNDIGAFGWAVALYTPPCP